MRALVVLLLWITVAGCARDDPSLCDPPAHADRSVEPYDNGVTLYTVQEGRDVSAWACNESEANRYLLLPEGGCPGSWTWTYTAPGAQAATHSWPASNDYGACNDWQVLQPGQADQRQLHLDLEPETGGEWRIRLQVYTQPFVLQDAGGGPVHAVYRF